MWKGWGLRSEILLGCKRLAVHWSSYALEVQRLEVVRTALSPPRLKDDFNQLVFHRMTTCKF
jgi:hypothetical protein